MIKTDFLVFRPNVRCKYFFINFHETFLNLVSSPDQAQKGQNSGFL